ncbi:MAG: glycosyltransferase family 2 protein [Chloroflexi bacterium]|nr:MAG: glycosyltransferase family 2 protein [Chloroflexota bacterium]RLC79963.1 MAG: glycosyltransferase family 2 protein [Chloroflexota bacterium]
MFDLGIVIVSYNTRDLLRACLRSVYASEGDFTYEVCVVDNGSPDDSAEMVAAEFHQVRLLANTENVGYPSANNQGLRAFGFTDQPTDQLANQPAFALLLNADTELQPDALARMLDFMAEHPKAGIAGPKLALPDGSLDLACRRSFPTPEVSFYRMVGLSRLFPHSRRFGRYNLTYLDPDQVAEIDSVVGAFMLVRGEAIAQAGLMDEQFFMYGEDLDWAFRIKAAGWKVYYNPAVTVLHVKRAASRHSPRAQVEFYRAMDIFYRKHYAAHTPWLAHALIVGVISLRQRLEQLRWTLAGRGSEVKV